jgi:hypothetical protein
MTLPREEPRYVPAPPLTAAPPATPPAADAEPVAEADPASPAAPAAMPQPHKAAERHAPSDPLDIPPFLDRRKRGNATGGAPQPGPRFLPFSTRRLAGPWMCSQAKKLSRCGRPDRRA